MKSHCKGRVSTRNFEGTIDVGLPISSQVYYLFCRALIHMSLFPNIFCITDVSGKRNILAGQRGCSNV